MKSKIVRLFFPFLIGIGLTVVLARVKYGESFESKKYIVYQSTGNDWLSKLVRIVPPSESSYIVEEIIQSNESHKLVEVVDNRSSFPRSFSFLDNNIDSRILKSPIILNRREVSFENYFSFLIDKDVFNEYIQAFHPSFDQDSIIEKYCFFLSSTKDSFYYRELNDSTDIELVKKRFNKNDEKPFPYHKIISNLNDVLYLSQTENISVYWFYDKGVLELLYKVSGNQLDTMEVKFLGYLGNEMIIF